MGIGRMQHDVCNRAAMTSLAFPTSSFEMTVYLPTLGIPRAHRRLFAATRPSESNVTDARLPRVGSFQIPTKTKLSVSKN